jgi:hypothetical protein
MCLEDLSSSDEISNWRPRYDAIYRSIIDVRDNRLIECMAAEIDGSEKRVAIIYGARHIRAVLRELKKREFYCSESNWRTIIST